MKSVPDGVGAARADSGGAAAQPLQAKADGNLTRRHIADGHRHKIGADLFKAPLLTAGVFFLKGGAGYRQMQRRLHAAGDAGRKRGGRERCRNAAGNVARSKTTAFQSLTRGGYCHGGGVLAFGAVIALTDSCAGRDPRIIGVHLSAQILIRHHATGQRPAGG